MHAIWWVRRDLRLHDNPALEAALKRADSVVPVFILDPNLLQSPYAGRRRIGFLLAALRSLARDLTARGRPLVVRHGDPLPVLKALVEETEAAVIFAAADSSPYARMRDARVARQLPVEWVGGAAIRPPGTVLKADGDPYVVYGPFRERWQAAPLPAAGELIEPVGSLPAGPDLRSDPLPTDPPHLEPNAFPASEAAARQRLAEFTSAQGGLFYYGQRRDRLAEDGTSRLSPYLRFGLVSAREAFVAGRQALGHAEETPAVDSVQAWLDELIWRDFYLHVLHAFPEARRSSFQAKYRGLPWQNDPAAFEAWKEGRTGYPLVDAAMRQLNATGWMHNRGRMIVASFLVKHLLIDWRWGERYFMQQLLDGDPASNNGGWQWAAGTGTDAAPYFRIFSPIRQSQQHDPKGRYIREWLPELARVPAKDIHEPWKLSADDQRAAGCRIGEDYPAPIVDHRQARARALQTYRLASEEAGSP